MNNTENEFLSIIIIAYNEEKYLPRLLDTLAKQTNQNFEIIIVDSNSTDNTIQKAKDYQHRFQQIKILVLDEPNGPAFGRNQGALVAKYERLLFLDADTSLKPNFIERILKSLKRNKADVATCPIRIAEGSLVSNMGAVFLNFFMIGLKPVYSSAYGACFISTRTIHAELNGFREDLAVCEDCNYVKRARRLHHYKFRILTPLFYTSDRRAKNEGGLSFMLKYIKIHLRRIFTKKEIKKGEITYNYGEF
ncbi:MAG: glycosyltransferase family 2 protein [Bacteroidales bacterium]|nr:glycosyltransferase family 2 protein [Bacteroidales bacterium]MBN2820782.1 glycosyltransferase family 2 protein [Bacteroidales bacterium]